MRPPRCCRQKLKTVYTEECEVPLHPPRRAAHQILLLSFTEEHCQRSPSGGGCTSAAQGGAPKLRIEMLVLRIAEGHCAALRIEILVLSFNEEHYQRSPSKGWGSSAARGGAP